MRDQLEALRRAWRERSPRDRAIATALFAIVALAVFALIWSAVQSERGRLQKALPLAHARLQRMQDDAAEVARLRAQAASPAAPSSIAEAVSASARSRHLDLTVAGEGNDRLQIHGSANFDDALAWLASIQLDYKLRVASLSASRTGSGVRIDAVLVAAAQ